MGAASLSPSLATPVGSRGSRATPRSQHMSSDHVEQQPRAQAKVVGGGTYRPVILLFLAFRFSGRSARSQIRRPRASWSATPHRWEVTWKRQMRVADNHQSG